MGKGLGRFLLSSLGRKFVMALTGFLLVGFLIMHLLGNLTLYADVETGENFIDYAAGMEHLGPIRYAAEIGLVLLFGIHIWTAFQLTRLNKAARPVDYAKKSTFGESTFASRSMFVTGLLVLAFLIVHLINFRFSEGLQAPDSENLFEYVKDVLSNPAFAAIYLIGSIVVGVHLSHGFRSAFQSLGAHHARLNVFAGRLGLFLAIVLGLGFASFPLVFLMIG